MSRAVSLPCQQASRHKQSCSSSAGPRKGHLAAAQQRVSLSPGRRASQSLLLPSRPLIRGQRPLADAINHDFHPTRAAGRTSAPVLSAAPENPLRLVMYTKPECPLCQGLEEKVQALIDQGAFMSTIMSQASLELRDVSTNEEWEKAFGIQIPVLARLDADGQEVYLPRPSPRLSADRLLRHIEKALA